MSMRLPFFSKQGTPQWEEILSDAGRGVHFWQNTIVRFLLFFATLPIVSSLVVLAFFIRPRETSIVLHYNVYFGVDVLGAWWQTYLLPLLGFFFFAVHTFLAAHFYQRTDRVASYLLLLAAGLISGGVLIASLSVAFINY